MPFRLWLWAPRVSSQRSDHRSTGRLSAEASPKRPLIDRFQIGRGAVRSLVRLPAVHR